MTIRPRPLSRAVRRRLRRERRRSVRRCLELQPPPYSVRSGDTLGTIADRFETTVDQLLALNPGIDPRALRVGETLRVSR